MPALLGAMRRVILLYIIISIDLTKSLLNTYTIYLIISGVRIKMLHPDLRIKRCRIWCLLSSVSLPEICGSRIPEQQSVPRRIGGAWGGRLVIGRYWSNSYINNLQLILPQSSLKPFLFSSVPHDPHIHILIQIQPPNDIYTSSRKIQLRT